jgi:hypothetical protein
MQNFPGVLYFQNARQFYGTRLSVFVCHEEKDGLICADVHEARKSETAVRANVSYKFHQNQK